MNPYNSSRNSYAANNNHLNKPQMASYSSINSLINSTGKINNNKSTHDRWICPNDRVLTLRAKLDAGWSVRCIPNSIRSHTPSPTPSPNSSTLALSSSPSCPDVSSSNVYNNNNNYNCNTSQVNQGSSGGSTTATSTTNNPITSCISEEEQAKILSVIARAKQVELMEKERINRLNERLKNMKRNVSIESSGKKDVCALCCEKFGFLPFTGKSFQCRDCFKMVCSKCMVDQANPLTGAMSYYCKICSETREMWKKSGAWFLKTLPTFPLIEKPPGESRASSVKSSPATIGRRRRPNFTIETATPGDTEDSLASQSNNPSVTSSSDKMADSTLPMPSESDSFSPNSSNSTTSTSSKSGSNITQSKFSFNDVTTIDASTASASGYPSHHQQQQHHHHNNNHSRRRILRSDSSSPPPPAPSHHQSSHSSSHYSQSHLLPSNGPMYSSNLLSPSTGSLNSLDSTVTVSSMSIHLPPGSPTPSTMSSLSGNTATTVDPAASSSSPAASSISSQFTFNSADLNKLYPNSGPNYSPPPPAPATPNSLAPKTSKLSFNPSKLLRSPSFRRKVKDRKSNIGCQASYECKPYESIAPVETGKSGSSTAPVGGKLRCNQLATGAGTPIIANGSAANVTPTVTLRNGTINHDTEYKWQSVSPYDPIGPVHNSPKGTFDQSQVKAIVDTDESRDVSGSSRYHLTTPPTTSSTMSIGSIRTSPWFQRRQMKNYPNQHQEEF